MNKELKQAIYRRSRLKNKYNKEQTIENKNNYKKQRNKCVNLRKKAVNKYFKNITESGIMENKLLSKTTLYKCATALSLMVKVEHHKLRPDKMKVSSLA